MNRRRLLQSLAFSPVVALDRVPTLCAGARKADAPTEAGSANALSLGMQADGTTDNMPLLRTAVAKALASGHQALFVPPGRYNFVARTAVAERVVMPPHFKLWSIPGAGCVFSVDPISYRNLADKQAVGILLVNHGNWLAGIDFDGQKALVNNGKPTTFGGTFVSRVSHTVSDVVIRDCTMNNNLGGLTFETFTVQTGFLSRRWLFENVVCRDNNGTGISVNGDMMNEFARPGGGLPSDITLRGCQGIGNLWQGMSVYGARNVRVEDCVGLNNGVPALYGGQGLNLEWVSDVTVHGGRFENNAGPGIGGFGWIDGVTIDHVEVRNNNQLDLNDQGEIGFKPGAWYTGPSVDGRRVPFRGSLQRLTIGRSASITPKPNGAIRNHLYLGPDPASNFIAGTVAASGTYPQPVGTQPVSVAIQARDVADWTVACNGGDGVKSVDMWLPGIRPTVDTEESDLATPLALWTASNMAVAPHPGEGPGSGVLLLTTNATGTYATTKTRLADPRGLAGGRKYRVDIRFRNISGDQHWGFCVRAPDWNTGTGAHQFDAHLSTLPGDTARWYTASLIVQLPDGSVAQPRFYNYGPASGAQIAVELSIKVVRGTS